MNINESSHFLKKKLTGMPITSKIKEKTSQTKRMPELTCFIYLKSYI